MRNLESLKQDLAAWRTATVETVSVDVVKTHMALQPRDEHATLYADRRTVRKQSLEHVIAMRSALEASKAATLEPILVCRTAGILYVVDGHHRLAATKEAERPTIAVRAREMTLKQAVQASRLVNIEGRSLALTRGQRSEMLWRYIIDITNGGQRSLREAGTSQRKAAAEFGFSSKKASGDMERHLTTAAELKQSRKLDDRERDPFTRWPTWRAVCRRLNPNFEEGTPEGEGEAVTKLAGSFAEAIGKHGVANAKRAWQLALADAGIEDDDGDEDYGF